MTRFVPLLLLALAASGPATAQTCTTSWLPDAAGVWNPGDWADADRWDNGVPTPADTACVLGAGTRPFTVTSGQPQTVGGLVVGSTTAALVLQLDAELTVTGAGRLFGSDAIRGDLALGGDFGLDGGSLLATGGTVTVTGALTVRATGAADNGFRSQVGASNNSPASTLVVDGGRVAFEEATTVSSTLDVSGGTVAVETSARPSGTLVTFRGGGSLQDLTLDTEAETQLSFRGAFDVGGTVDGSADGIAGVSRFSTLAIGAADVAFAVGGDLGFALSTSESGSASELTVTTAGGEILNAGLLRLPRRTVFDGVTIRSTGTLRVDGAGRADLTNGSEIVIEESGTLLFTDALGTGNRFIYGNSISDPGDARITVRGRITEAGGAAADGIAVPVDVLGGTVDVTSGILAFEAGGTLQSPTLSASADGRLVLRDGAWATSGTISGTSVELPAGTGPNAGVRSTIEIAANATLRATAPVTLAIQGGGLQVGTPAGGATLTASGSGAFTATTPVHVVGGSTLRAVPLGIEDRLVSTRGSFALEEDARLEIGPDATATFNGGLRLGDGTGALVNEGLVQTGPAGSSVTFRGLLDARPGSELRVTNGPGLSNETLNLSQEDPAGYGTGVTLSGRGGISTGFQTLLQGTVSPGTMEAPFDTLGMTSLRFDPTEGTPRFVVDVGDGVSDVVNTGDAGILEPGGATLVIRVAEGFVPVPGDEWVVARRFSNSAAPTGAFPVLEVEGAPDGVTFVQDPEAEGAIVVRAVAPTTIAAREAEVAEGATGAFVLTHPSLAEAYTVRVAASGTATRFADYTLGLAGGRVRVQANTTQTVVPVFARRDADAGEGAETLTLTTETGGTATVTLVDSPSSTALAVDAITPARGAIDGIVTATILGSGFGEGATVRLDGPAPIEGSRVEILSGGTGLEARFDLLNAPAGTYDVVVTSGETATLAGAFVVAPADDGTTRALWASITGTPSPRVGRWSTYTATVGNDLAFDLHDVYVILRITAGVEYEAFGAERIEADEPEWLDEVPIGTTSIFGEVIPVYVPRLPANGSHAFTVRVRPTQPGREVTVSVEAYEPNFEALYTYTGAAEDYRADVAAGRPTHWGIGVAMEDILLDAFEEGGARLAGSRNDDCDAPPFDLVRTRQDLIAQGYDPPPLDSPLWDAALKAPVHHRQKVFRVISNLGRPEYSSSRTTLEDFGNLRVYDTAGGRPGRVRSRPIRNLTPDDFRNRRHLRQSAASASFETVQASGCTSTPPGASSSGGGVARGSFDPNDKLGPSGAGEARYYRPDGSAFPYTIRFENLDTATGPAQEVVIVDTLDAAVFDLSTFRLGPIAYGIDGRVEPPAGATAFETSVDLPDLDASLLVTASLDPETGRAVWTFATLDDATGDLPEDARIGFLPPNDDTGRGEGAVQFTIETFDDLADGTAVSNQAEIVFDVNAPIVTPVWTNTVDLTAPTSRAVSAERFDADTSWVVRFDPEDAGAGVSSVALYAQADGGPFAFAGITSADSLVFRGAPGVAYGFFSLAADRAQNTEAPKTEAEAFTFPVATEPDAALPEAVALAPPYPNPTRGEAVLQIGLPAAGPLRAVVYDVRGREVAVVADG
ncbi:MAG: hypothetical protein AAF594_07130, partial [Bacteroidota bacterium]